MDFQLALADTGKRREGEEKVSRCYYELRVKGPKKGRESLHGTARLSRQPNFDDFNHVPRLHPRRARRPASLTCELLNRAATFAERRSDF